MPSFDTWPIILDVALVFLAVAMLLRLGPKYLASRSLILPPGPKGLPWVGNLRMLHQAQQRKWEVYAQWSKRWGRLTYLTSLGWRILIVNSKETTIELLERRGAIYCDRPSLYVVRLVELHNMIGLNDYDHGLRTSRQMVAKFIGSTAALKPLHTAFESESSRFLVMLLKSPDDFADHVRTLLGRTILPFLYGYHPKMEGEDPVIRCAKRGMEAFDHVTDFGSFPVDVVPLLRYIPSWLPGGRWKHLTSPYKRALDEMGAVPFRLVKEQVLEGNAVPSFVSRNLESFGSRPTSEQEHHLKWTAAGVWAGSSDTTPVVMSNFFLTTMLYPEVQAKAQEEIDRVVGHDRLPMIEDRSNLPYVEALIKEVLRFYPPVPLAFPHSNRQDDIYDGYLIPKSTMVIVNVWDIMHNSQYYSDPFAFKPERFIPTSDREAEQDPAKFVFGFGRRICPGRRFADAIAFICIAKVLSVFNIAKPLDANGNPIEPVVDHEDGTVSHPKPFKCCFKPRSERAAVLASDSVAHD